MYGIKNVRYRVDCERQANWNKLTADWQHTGKRNLKSRRKRQQNYSYLFFSIIVGMRTVGAEKLIGYLTKTQSFTMIHKIHIPISTLFTVYFSTIFFIRKEKNHFTMNSILFDVISGKQTESDHSCDQLKSRPLTKTQNPYDEKWQKETTNRY